MADIEKENEDGTSSSDARDEESPKGSVRDLVKSAGAFLDDLDAGGPASEQANVSESEAGVDAESDPERPPRKSKSKKSKGKTAALEAVAWNAETANLDFNEPESSNSDGLSEFEALARRVAATVSKNQGGSIEEAEEVEETKSADMEPGADSSEERLAEPAIETGEEQIETTEDWVEAADVNIETAEEAMVEDDIVIEETLETASHESDGENEAQRETSQRDSTQMEQTGFAALTENSEAESGDSEDESEEIAQEPTEFIEHDQLVSIVESLLFSTDKPVSVATIKQIFKGSNVRTRDIHQALEMLASEYAAPNRGVTLEEIHGGFQLRTKSDNADYLRRLSKTRPFRLSGPALEVMAIVAYKQPVTKHEIDEIRGVESGHLLRALMERGLLCFNGKSDLPGKPMTYGSTRKFLETFGLRNLKELPTLSEIDELLPEGIGEVEEKETLADITEQMSQELASSYSEGEEELDKINQQLQQIDTTSEFFEQEKQRERERRDRERAQDIRERLVLGDDVEEKDRRWLDRYEARLAAESAAEEQVAQSGAPVVISADEIEEAEPIRDQLEALSAEGAPETFEAAEGEEADMALDDLSANLDWSEDSEIDGSDSDGREDDKGF